MLCFVVSFSGIGLCCRFLGRQDLKHEEAMLMLRMSTYQTHMGEESNKPEMLLRVKALH